MTNLVETQELELPLQPQEKFEKRGVEYFLNNEKIPSVSEVVGSGGGGKGSANGNAFHEAMANYFLTGSMEGFFEEVEEYETDEFGYLIKKPTIRRNICNPEDFKIAERLANFLKENNLKPRYVEHKGVYKDKKGLIFGYTIDLISKNQKGEEVIIDYKSGISEDEKHKNQVGGYMLARNTHLGYIIYRHKIVKVEVSSSIYFYKLLLAFYKQLEGFIWHNGKIYNTGTHLIDSTLQLKELLLKKSELESEIEDLKGFISSNLGDKGYKDDNVLVSYVKSRVNKTLKKDVKKELLSSNPEYFEEKEVEAYFNFKIQGDK